MSISSQRICYAIGLAAWGAKSAQEGLPVLEHFEPEAVIDTPSAPQVAKAERFPDGQDARIGPLYYIATVPMLFSPAHSILFLDKFFERTTVGAAPDYRRYYTAEDIPNDPAGPYLCLWKRTARTGLDHNLCCSNGIVTGIALEKTPGSPMKLSVHCAFGARNLVEASPAAATWEIDRRNGNFDPVPEGGTSFYITAPGGSPAEFKVHTFHLSLSGAFTPHFWKGQTPDRFSRGAVALSGDITLRDIVDQVESLTAALEGSSSKEGIFSFGANAGFGFNFRLTSGLASEDEITRNGTFKFSGVSLPGSSGPVGMLFNVKAGRAYMPPAPPEEPGGGSHGGPEPGEE
jgi:hypothetical protein